jgi:hypothetical protein
MLADLTSDTALNADSTEPVSTTTENVRLKGERTI